MSDDMSLEELEQVQRILPIIVLVVGLLIVGFNVAAGVLNWNLPLSLMVAALAHVLFRVLKRMFKNGLVEMIAEAQQQASQLDVTSEQQAPQAQPTQKQPAAGRPGPDAFSLAMSKVLKSDNSLMIFGGLYLVMLMVSSFWYGLGWGIGWLFS